MLYHANSNASARRLLPISANESSYSSRPPDKARCGNGFHFRFMESGNFSIRYTATLASRHVSGVLVLKLTRFLQGPEVRIVDVHAWTHIALRELLPTVGGLHIRM